jgi:SAM-dependent methyltransferase
MSEHYGRASAPADILSLVTDTSADGLAPLDQLHPGGLAASRLLARLAKIIPGEKVLDAGCGIGGSARLLASEFRAEVTGVDLSPSFVEIARSLAEKSGTPGRFECADALDLPFDDACFDVVWTQHAGANICDKRRFYLELRRVLRQGGRLAFQDEFKGPSGEQPHTPLPFADTAEEVFLSDGEQQRNLLRELGFRELLWLDRTAATIVSFRNLPKPDTTKISLGLHLLLGPDYPVMLDNIQRSFAEGRLGAALGVYLLD